MIRKTLVIALGTVLACACTQKTDSAPELQDIKVQDGFWSPRMEQWRTTTAKDVLDKFENDGAYANFDKVAAGQRNTKDFKGLPWFDGLVYETIRGLSDLIAAHPDPSLEERLDGIISRITTAQASEKDNYLVTYVELMDSTMRWGLNGGFQRWQHDVYNQGCLVEAGIHYYKATGKTELLEDAVRTANMMASLMGPSPKQNIVPAHSQPEEALMKLYWLFKEEPGLAGKINEKVKPEEYRDLAQFWVDSKGDNCGYPHWVEWGDRKSEIWIRENKYDDPRFGGHTRPSFGFYAQDSIPVLRQTAIEGHSVRATLLYTGVVATVLETGREDYAQVCRKIWDNMVGKRYFITGGVGSEQHIEGFGADYSLPVNAYLETCAAVGAAFFDQRMNQLTGDARYMDEYERSLYNNILAGISLSGTKYTYQNPLNADGFSRWDWHGCPCCPPMFLKSVGSMPGHIWSVGEGVIRANLFVGNETAVTLGGDKVGLKMDTGYPWKGDVKIEVYPPKDKDFTLDIRIPGWSVGIENPFGLYTSGKTSAPVLKVNGETTDITVENGYASVKRIWKAGDTVELFLPMEPRIVRAKPEVKELQDMAAVSYGPLVYCAESVDNPSLETSTLDPDAPMTAEFKPDILSGTVVIKAGDLTLIPYHLLGNRAGSSAYKTWIPIK